MRLMKRRRRKARRDDNPKGRKRATRIRRRGRRRSNPRGWFRTRGGRRFGRRGVKRRIRGSRRFTRPTRRSYRRRRHMAYNDNPPRRRRRLGGRRRSRARRRYSSNPRHSRSRRRRYSSNPARRSYRLLDNPLKAVTDVFKQAFSGDTIETMIHTAVGFGGAAAGARLVYNKLIPDLGKSPIGRVGTTFGVSLIESVAAGYVMKDARFGSRMLIGGLLATLWQGLTEVLPAEAKEYIPTLGQDAETESFRKAIEQEVVRELRGGGGPATQTSEGMSVYLQPAGVSEVYLRAAGSETYLTSSEAKRADRAGMSTYLTQRDVERSEAGMGTYDSEFSATAMPERF